MDPPSTAPTMGRKHPRKEGSVVAGRKRGEAEGRCAHVGFPLEVERVEGGRAARCLGCGHRGPVRPSSEGAVAALRAGARRSSPEAG